MRTPPSMPRPLVEVSKMFRLSGVVTRISGGCRAMRRRSSDEESPLRTATRTGAADRPALLNAWESVSSGDSRLRSMSLLSAFSGDT